MSNGDLSSYKGLYVRTTYSDLGNLKDNITNLLSHHKNEELIKKIYIQVHSLKGKSVVMGYMKTGSLCSMMENIFYEIKNGRMSASKELLTIILKAIEKVNGSIESIEKNDRELDLTQDIKQLENEIISIRLIK